MLLTSLLTGVVVIFFLWILDRLVFRGYLCKEVQSLKGKLAVVTGASVDIGIETAAELARRGATVVLACENLDKGRNAVRDILRRYGEEVPSAMTTNVANLAVQLVLQPVKSEQVRSN